MDLALSRLRINPGDGGCSRAGATKVCADQELFERLVSEFAVTMAPPTSGPARGGGPRGFQLTLNTTVTSIEGGRSYWVYGTEGDGKGDDGTAANDSPQSVMVWNRAEARKGLPFGFEVAAALGQGLNTSLWSYGLALKWALVEGYHSGLGQMPDVSLQAALDRSVGSSQATLQVFSLDLTLSKPFVIDRTWTISPFTGLQMLWSHVTSGMIDLTPGGPADAQTRIADPSRDAYNACKPAPGNTQGGPTLACTTSPDAAADFSNNVAFKTLDQTRARMFLGGQARYQMLLMSMSLLFDLIAPDLGAKPRLLRSGQVARQLAFSVAVGAVL